MKNNAAIGIIVETGYLSGLWSLRPPARPFGEVLVYSAWCVCAGDLLGFSCAALSRLRAATARSSVSPKTQLLGAHQE